MERIIRLHIEKLPEGAYLATSEDVQGLIAEGRTLQETIEIARDVARLIFELRGEENVTPVEEITSIDIPVVIAA